MEADIVSAVGVPATDEAVEPRARRRREIAALVVLALVAPLVTFREVLLSGFTVIPGDAYDGRLNAFFLEHSWRWLVREPLDRSLWGLPVFFPHGQNALAYSDLMVSFGPLYWPWRALGFAPDTSYALWCLSVVAAGIVAGYALLRLAVGLSPVASGVGAWLVACSASRLHQVSHSQLLPMVYVAVGLAGAIAWARAESGGARRASASLAAGALVAQLYGGFYQGLFLAAVVALLAVLALALRKTRASLVQRLRADAWVLLVIGALAALALVPWYRHYHAAQSVVGNHDWEQVETMVPRPASWLFMTPTALAYGWTERFPAFRGLPWYFEHPVGLGLLTTACCLAAAFAGRRRVAVRLTVLAVAVIVAVTTMVGGHSAWRVVLEHAPPLGAARAIVRLGLMLPIAAAVLLGTWLDAARGAGRRVVLALLVACAAEQLTVVDTHPRDVQRRWVGELAALVDRKAAAFVASRSSDKGGAMLLHLDAMFAADLTGIPTVNGASGNEPPGWEMRGARVRNELAARVFRGSLESWLASGGVDPASVQWIQLPARYRGGVPARPPRTAREQRSTGPHAPPATALPG